jgi:hypothetical protein
MAARPPGGGFRVCHQNYQAWYQKSGANFMEKKKKKDDLSVASFVLGIVSIFLWEFSIIPLLAVVFGVIGLKHYRDDEGDLDVGSKWMPIAGCILGILYLLVRIANIR